MRLSLICVLFSALCIFGNLLGKAEVRYKSAADKMKIENIIKTAAEGNTLGDRIVLAAKSLQGIPSGLPSDNDSVGTIMISLDSLDRIGFLNLVLTTAMTSRLSSPTLFDFENKLENISRRKGKDEGFASQFHYISDWIVDNVYRGNVKEMTEYIEAGNYKTKTLDRISHNRADYPALADSAVYDKIKIMEMGYRSHRIPHLKKQSVSNKAIQELYQNGDIIVLLAPDSDYDLYDLGFIEIIGGLPYLIHISRQSDAVILDEFPLSRLFKLEGQHFYGFRWLRPID